MFEGYPEAFLEVVRETDPRAVAEHGIFTRQAEALPADGWGRGRVTLLGDAAHPVRPTGVYYLYHNRCSKPILYTYCGVEGHWALEAHLYAH